MKFLMKRLKRVLKAPMQEGYKFSAEYRYLSGSKDLVQLEQRQRLIQIGQAPWQVRAKVNNNLKGWV